MQLAGSITRWIEQAKAGERTAAGPVWERYFTRLVRLARKRLQGARRAADEEDVALSALDSVYRGLEQGRFPQLLDRDSLWRLLVVITERKALDQSRDERRQKRGGGRVGGGSALLSVANGPDPAFAALMAEECRRLLDLLGGGPLRQLVLLKMEGYTNEEIAGQLGCALRTVERKLGLVRGIWEQEVER